MRVTRGIFFHCANLYLTSHMVFKITMITILNKNLFFIVQVMGPALVLISQGNATVGKAVFCMFHLPLRRPEWVFLILKNENIHLNLQRTKQKNRNRKIPGRDSNPGPLNVR